MGMPWTPLRARMPSERLRQRSLLPPREHRLLPCALSAFLATCCAEPVPLLLRRRSPMAQATQGRLCDLFSTVPFYCLFISSCQAACVL